MAAADRMQASSLCTPAFSAWRLTGIRERRQVPLVDDHPFTLLVIVRRLAMVIERLAHRLRPASLFGGEQQLGAPALPCPGFVNYVVAIMEGIKDSVVQITQILPSWVVSSKTKNAAARSFLPSVWSLCYHPSKFVSHSRPYRKEPRWL